MMWRSILPGSIPDVAGMRSGPILATSVRRRRAMRIDESQIGCRRAGDSGRD